MSDPTAARVRVINGRDQPVELIIGGQAVVVPPYGQVELDESALNSPQLQALEHRRFIRIRRLEEPPTPSESPPASAAGQSTRRRSSRKRKKEDE